jgi:hypothetical protein
MKFNVLRKYLKPNNFDQFYIELLIIYNLFLITLFATFFKGYVLLFLIYFVPSLLVIFFFLLKIIFYKTVFRFPLSFFYTIFVFVILCLIGVLKGNYLTDIFSNAIFFISPLLSFYLVSSVIVNNSDKLWLIKNYILLSSIQVLFFFALKLVNVSVLNEDIINYKAFNVGGLQSSFLILIYFLYSKRKYVNIYGRYFSFFLFLLFINEILVPIVLPFKQLLLLLLLFLIYVFIYILPRKYLFIVVGFIIFLTTLNYEKVYVFARLFSHFNDIFSNSIFLDKRVVEIYGVINTINSNLPFSLIYGEGFGGLWDSSKIGIDISYLKQVDFRINTLVSMVHSSFFTLFLRGGFLSLSCYLLFLFKVYFNNKLIIKKLVFKNDIYFFLKSFKFYFILYLIASFFDWYIYANSFIGILFAISTFNPYNNLNEDIN